MAVVTCLGVLYKTKLQAKLDSSMTVNEPKITPLCNIVRKKKGERTVFIGIIMAIILGSMLTFVRGEGHVIDKFTHSPGLHFEPVGKLYLSYQQWTIAAATDVTPWFDRADQVMDHLIKARLLSKKAFLYGENFYLIICQWIEDFEETRKLISGLLGLEETRGRRGIIDGLGSLAKSLIGTMDANDAKEIFGRLDQLEKGQGHYFSMTGKQIEVLNATISQIRTTEEIIQENEQILLRTTKEAIDALGAEQGHLKLREILDEHFMIVEALMNAVLRDAETIKRLLTDKSGSILSRGIFTEAQLVTILRKGQLPKGLSFPFELKVGGMHMLEEVSTVDIHLLGNKIIMLVAIPLVTFEAFDIFMTHGIPVRTTPEYHSYFEPETELLVIHGPTRQHIVMTKEELSNCRKLKDQYICTEILPVQIVRSYSPCEVQMFIEPGTLPKTCIPKHVAINRTVLVRMMKDHAWLYVAPHPEHIRVRCDDKEKREILEGSGILQVLDFCEITASDFTIRGRKTSGLNMELHVHPKLNLTLTEEQIGQLNKSSTEIMSNTHLKSIVKNVGELQGLQLKLGEEKESLKETTEDWFNYRDFVTHTSSIASLISVAATLTLAGLLLRCWCQRPRQGPVVPTPTAVTSV